MEPWLQPLLYTNLVGFVAFFFGISFFGGSYFLGFGFLVANCILLVVLDDAMIAGFVSSTDSEEKY